MQINIIYNENCLDTMARMPDDVLDAIIIDPPYGENMGYSGDDNLSSAENLLNNFLKTAESKIKTNKHIAVFWTMKNLDVCIDIIRENGFYYRRTLSMYIPRGNARPYLGWLPRTQAIVIAQKYLPQKASVFHNNLTDYLNEVIKKHNLTKSQIAKMLKCDSRLVMKWTRQNDPAWCLPTPRFYIKLKDILNLDDKFDILLTRQKEENSIDIDYQHDTYIVDSKIEKMFHPSQKPIKVIEHIIRSITKPNDLVYDGFCGSGTTCKAAKKLNRNFIGSEISAEYCEIANKLLGECNEL